MQVTLHDEMQIGPIQINLIHIIDFLVRNKFIKNQIVKL